MRTLLLSVLLCFTFIFTGCQPVVTVKETQGQGTHYDIFFPYLNDARTSICLSGGGYRAMLFHLGMLWRLNELGMLPEIRVFNSVSGGSIVSAQLASKWDELDFDPITGVASNFVELVAQPIIHLSEQTIDVYAVLKGMLTPSTAAIQLSRYYDRYLFDNKLLFELPERQGTPSFNIFATELNLKKKFVFTANTMGVSGKYASVTGTTKVSEAVAASSAYPPVLAPLIMNIRDVMYETISLEEVATYSDEAQRASFMWFHLNQKHLDSVLLADGGLIDNLASEECNESDQFAIISDASRPPGFDPDVSDDWISITEKTIDIIYVEKEQQIRENLSNVVLIQLKNDLRLQVYEHNLERVNAELHKFAEYSEYTYPNEFRDNNTLAFLPSGDEVVSSYFPAINTKTRLKSLPTIQAMKLVNWGYLHAQVQVIDFLEQLSHITPGTPNKEYNFIMERSNCMHGYISKENCPSGSYVVDFIRFGFKNISKAKIYLPQEQLGLDNNN